nr:ATP-binding protein [Pigmentibacter ruber]
MNHEEIKQLINNQECEFIDFKREYHKNNSDLIHDILCLANSKTDSKYKYLIFGVDDDKNFFDIKNDIKRKKENDLMDLVKNARLNNLPNIKLFALNYRDNPIDIIQIQNINHKPYFLTQDYGQGKDTIRAGVVYTRLGSSNTPKNGSATPKQIEDMYRERFNIDKTPNEKIMTYLKDKNNWKYNYVNDTKLHFYYEPDPNFSIISEKSKFNREYFENWVLVFNDQKSYTDILTIKYKETKIGELILVWCDGGRFGIPLPSILQVKKDESKYYRREYVSSYFYINNSLKHLFLEMINSTYPQHGVENISEFIEYFDSREDAEYELKNDFKNKTNKYKYFIHENSNEKNSFFLQSGGKISELYSRFIK